MATSIQSIAVLMALLGLVPQVHAQALQALDDASLSDVSGREGIAIDIEMHLNTDANGVPLAALGNCRNTNLCNIAIQPNNRLNGGGEWLVLKDVSASMRIKNLFIDAAFTALNPSPYADSNRFKNAAGTICLPTGGAYNAATCAASVLDKPTVQFSYPGSYAAFETDVELYLSIGRMAIQYTNDGGFSADRNGSIMGILVSDTTQRHSKIDFDGKVFLSGF